jgi:ATP-dependent DNA ligase
VLGVEEHGRELYEAVQRLDLEGIVAKRKTDPYSPQSTWYKIKKPRIYPDRRQGGPIRATVPLTDSLNSRPAGI